MENKEKKKIFFRADGSSEIGLGHIVRSSALAGMLSQEYTCVLATRCNIKPLLEELQSVFAQIISLPVQDYSSEARGLDAIIPSKNLVILDGYNFDSAYQECLVKKGFELFSIDDIHAFQFHSKIIINHSGGLSPLDYRSFPSTQYYLGPHYALLRKPFLEAAKKRRKHINDKNCFVCFGGADPQNKTLEILKSSKINSKAYFDRFHVVVGGAYRYKTELEDYTRQQENISVHYTVSTEEMVSIMQQCSYAICSPSTVVYEYLSVGGIVFLEQIADNQTDVISYLTEEGMAFRLTDLGSITDSQIEETLEKGAFYFDGRSGERLRKLFRQYFEGQKLFVRKVEMGDIERCYQWANDSEVRMQSYSQASINLEEHTDWFTQKLKDPNSYFYILELQGEPVAQIRFQVSDKEAVLGFLADKTIRSKGLGATILGKGIDAFIRDYKNKVKITGFVKRSNIASQRSFERLAFNKEETTEYPNSFKYTMIYGN